MKLKTRSVAGETVTQEYTVSVAIQIELNATEMSWTEMQAWIEELLWDYPEVNDMQITIAREDPVA